MSFDSRLFRPRRSNSSSASSALVSVGVSSVGSRTARRGRGVGSAMVVDAPVTAARRRTPRRGSSAASTPATTRVDALVGQRRRRRRSSSSRTRQAALAGGDAGRRASSARRCRTASSADAPAAPRPRRSPPSARRGVTLFAGDDARGRATPTAAAAAARSSAAARAHQRVGVELEQHRRCRQLVGLAPARVQLADEADARGRRARSRRCGPGAAPDARAGTKLGAAARAAPRGRP